MSICRQTSSLQITAIIICIHHLFQVNAQYTEIWYDDMEKNNGWTPSPSESVNFSYGSSSCPDDSLCTRTVAGADYADGGDSYIMKSTDISAYASLQLRFSVGTYEHEAMDTCQVHIAYDITSAKTLIAEIDPVDDEQTHLYPDQIADLPSASGKTTVYIWLEAYTYDGTGMDNCYWDNIYLMGIPGAAIPTVPPTKKPTPLPTMKPTPITSPPTMKPTPPPTKKPTPPPTKKPTPSPIATPNPTTQPTHNPTSQPTSTPTPPFDITSTSVPSKCPTEPPTDDPTKTTTGVTDASSERVAETHDVMVVTIIQEKVVENNVSLMVIVFVCVGLISCLCMVLMLILRKVYKAKKKKKKKKSVKAQEMFANIRAPSNSISNDDVMPPGFKKNSVVQSFEDKTVVYGENNNNVIAGSSYSSQLYAPGVEGNQAHLEGIVEGDRNDIEELYAVRGNPTTDTNIVSSINVHQHVQTNIVSTINVYQHGLTEQGTNAQMTHCAINKCVDCGYWKQGKTYPGDALFYCNDCWGLYFEATDAGTDTGTGTVQYIE